MSNAFYYIMSGYYIELLSTTLTMCNDLLAITIYSVINKNKKHACELGNNNMRSRDDSAQHAILSFVII